MEWISVKDRLPDSGERVLVIDDGYIFISFISEKKSLDDYQWGVIRNCSEDGSIKGIGFWMPLPGSPNEQKD